MKCARCGINDAVGNQAWCEDCFGTRERDEETKAARFVRVNEQIREFGLYVGQQVRYHPIIHGNHDGNVYEITELRWLKNGECGVRLANMSGLVWKSAVTPFRDDPMGVRYYSGAKCPHCKMWNSRIVGGGHMDAYRDQPMQEYDEYECETCGNRWEA